jgi:ADP-ribosylation factor GTPase-activating protein 1
MEKLKKESSNNFCFDCGSSDSEWTSVNNGIFLCLKCAGVHRGLGVQISFVRSITMDEWNEKQLKMMEFGGNEALEDFLTSYCMQKNLQVYRTKAVQFYRDCLKARAEGGELCVEPPDLEIGQQPVIETASFIENLKISTQGLTFQQILEKFWLNAKEYSKNLSDKIKDLTFEDIKGKTTEIFHEISEKVENFDYKGTFTGIKVKSEEIYESIKESTKQTMENPGETFREKYESSKVAVVETYEKSKAKVIETYESSKEKIKENYQHSVERLQGSEIVQKAKSILGK